MIASQYAQSKQELIRSRLILIHLTEANTDPRSVLDTSHGVYELAFRHTG